MDVDKRYNLTVRNTQEIIGDGDLKKLLKEKEQPVIYLGTAPTGRPHVGYLLWGLKIADLLKAGWKVKILLADLHAALDNVSWEDLDDRYNYYAEVIPLMIKAMGADPTNLEIIKGSDFQLKPEYMFDVLRESSHVSVKDANKAASEVVKMGSSPRLSGLLYPLMQNMDEIYLEADAQLGGNDQRKIMVLARENLPKLGYDSRIEILLPLVPGLVQGGKMSSSVDGSKIDLLDDEEEVQKKLNKAYCLEGDSQNGLLPFLKYVLMVIKQDSGETFNIERPEKFGGNKNYETYEQLEKDFLDKTLHPMDLKKALAKEIVILLKKIQGDGRKLKELSEKGYKEK